MRVGSIHNLFLLFYLPSNQFIELFLYLKQLLGLSPQLTLVLFDSIVLEDVDCILFDGSEENSPCVSLG